MYKATTATQKILRLNKRIRAVAGGTAASKTISILLWLIDYAQSVHNQLISVVSVSFPHLYGGAMLDFETIMKEHKYWEDGRWVKNPRPTYLFSTGSKIEFISVDTYGKAHGPRRDILFINEANNLAYNIADQLITRTRDIVWLDWNPVSEFWFYTEMLNRRDDIDFLTLTYLDNEALDENTKKEIEAHRHNKSWWRVYGEGQLGDVEGRIYTGWQFLDEIPHEARLERRGLDYGYSNDPTAIVDIYHYNGGWILDERLYQKGMSNKQIADFLGALEYPSTMVRPDSAEPKSNDELHSYGINVLPAQKGPGSVTQGIQYVQSQKIWVTKRSINLIREYNNYMWMMDKNGKVINTPIDLWNHCLDALRYGMEQLQGTDPNLQKKLRNVQMRALEGEFV